MVSTNFTISRVPIGLLYLLFAFMIGVCSGHGGMTSPPARNIGDVDWNSANKGSQEGLWTDEKTNICGAVQYIQPEPIVATYTAGQVVAIQITITAFHNGYYEFRLCVPPNAKDEPPTTNKGLIKCLLDPNTPLLKRVTPLKSGERADYKMANPPVWGQLNLETRWRQMPQDGSPTGTSYKGYPTTQLLYKIPDVQCNHCVLHWYWQTLNNYQNNNATTMDTTSGERFWNCADIKITNSKGANSSAGILYGPQVGVKATCSDKVQNQGEEGIDCGGPCPKCAFVSCSAISCPTTQKCVNEGNSDAYCADKVTNNPMASCTSVNKIAEKQTSMGQLCQGASAEEVPSGCCTAILALIKEINTVCTSPQQLVSGPKLYSSMYNCENPMTSTPNKCNPEEWKTGTAYVTGSRVSYQGQIFVCIASHTSNPAWTPLAAFTLWQLDQSCKGSTVPVDPCEKKGYIVYSEADLGVTFKEIKNLILHKSSDNIIITEGNAFSIKIQGTASEKETIKASISFNKNLPNTVSLRVTEGERDTDTGTEPETEKTEPETKPSDGSSQDGIPGWGIFLVVAASILIVVIVSLVVLTQRHHAANFIGEHV